MSSTPFFSPSHIRCSQARSSGIDIAHPSRSTRQAKTSRLPFSSAPGLPSPSLSLSLLSSLASGILSNPALLTVIRMSRALASPASSGWVSWVSMFHCQPHCGHGMVHMPSPDLLARLYFPTQDNSLTHPLATQGPGRDETPGVKRNKCKTL